VVYGVRRSPERYTIPAGGDIRMIGPPGEPILPIRHSQHGIYSPRVTVANSNTQVISLLSLIRAFGFRG
jgi:hypothetical protein